MQARTAFRLAMLANGYQPLLNDCKRSIETGWPTQARRRGRGAVVGPQRADLDGPEARRRSRGDRRRRERRRPSSTHWRAHSTRASPSCSRTASCATPAAPRKPGSRASTSRSGGSPRGAGIAAAIRTIPQCRSIMVECFGSLGTRQFGDRRAACPRPPGRGDQHLPVRRRRLAGDRRRGRRCRCCRRRPTRRPAICSTGSPRRPGSPPSRRARRGRGEATAMCFELDADTEIETHDYGAMTVAELERFMRARRAHANAPATLRCSGSFHDPTRVRTDSHLINWGRYGLGIYDTMTETTWHRRERAPSARVRISGAIARRRTCAMAMRFRRRRDQPGRPGIPGEPRRPPAGAAPALRDAVPAAARLRAVRSDRSTIRTRRG